MENLDPTALIASGAIVIFLTQQAKRWIPSDFLPLVAFALGIAVQLINDLALTTDGSSPATVWVSIVVGAGVGMAAAGVYDLAGRTKTDIPPATINVDDSWLPAETPPIFGAEPGVVPGQVGVYELPDEGGLQE